MPCTGNEHRNTCRICRSNHLFIANTATRLDNCGHASASQNFKAICKWEEGITCRNCADNAIACAINDALDPIGTAIAETPMSHLALWGLIRAARAKPKMKDAA